MVRPKPFKAQQAAAHYLQMRGYEVIEFNFRRSRYHIDIVAKKGGEIYFVYLELLNQTPDSYNLLVQSEVNQMRLAAASWIEEYEWQGAFHYSAVEVDLASNQIMSFNENFL